MKYFDAHNHLHDHRFAGHREELLAALASLSLGRAMVNGTSVEDWDAVCNLCGNDERLKMSFGLHPWYSPKRSTGWLDVLRDRLIVNPEAGVGEIGLDRWIEGYNLPDQTEVFVAQFRLAVELERPVTIHCVRAWGALWDAIREERLPQRGFLLHAYAGPVEMIRGFVERGAFFSFSPYFLHERKAAQREAFCVIPEDRLLVETDAPDLRPPDEKNPRPLIDVGGTAINHPANIDVAYAGLAEVRKWDVEKVAAVTEANFRRLFG